MELEHSFTVPLTRQQAWDVLLDVERVAPCMPGATLDSVDGDEIKGRIKVKVGPIAMIYAGTARFTERDAAAGVVTLEASGKETRGSGTASASVRSVLADQGEQTQVTVRTNLNVTGRPAQFGRGVLAEVSGKLLDIFAANLAATLAADQGNAAGGSAADDAAAETAAGDADPKTTSGTQTTWPAGTERADAAQATGSAARDLPLEDLKLPLRSYNSLRRQGVHTVGELAARTADELLAIENIGPASVAQIQRRLGEHGLRLGESPATGNGAPAPAAAAAQAPPAADQSADDAIDLLSVAGLPVLKRAVPVLTGLAAVAVVVIAVRLRRRRSRG